MVLTMDERAQNAVMWHLYTNRGVAPLGHVMRINVPRIPQAVNFLRQHKKIELMSGSLNLRMVDNG